MTDISTLKHEDGCRYWTDGEFCTCGSDTAHELREVNYQIDALRAQPKIAYDALERIRWLRDPGQTTNRYAIEVEDIAGCAAFQIRPSVQT